MLQSMQDTMAAIRYGVTHAAALIYHDVMAAEADVTEWLASHPNLAPLFRDGVELAIQAIRRTGFSTDAISIVAEDIIAAVRGLAVGDASVVGVEALQDVAALVAAHANAQPIDMTPTPSTDPTADADPKAADKTGGKGKKS